MQRLLRWLAGLALVCVLPASAATYNYRSDTFDWETAANAVTWDRTCTQYPGDDDKSVIAFTGGMKFRFAGTDYTSVRILANGMLQFGSDTGFHRNYTNTTLPASTALTYTGCTAGAATNLLMAYWTDLNPSQAGSGNVTLEQKGVAPNRRFVVSWNNVYQYNTSTPYAVQIVLYENGEFKYQYGNNNATGVRATIGVQVSSTDYTLYSYNSGYNANGTAIRWSLTNTTPTRLAEYRFDEYAYTGRVGELRDSSGNANHGVVLGGATSNAAGAVCRGLDVPASATGALVGADTQVNAASALGARGGLSLWWRYASAWNGGSAAMLVDASGSTAMPIFLQRDAGGALRLRVTDGNGTTLTAVTAAQAFAAGTWVHIAASWSLAAGSNQSTLRLFVNGVLSATAVGTTNGAIAGNAASVVAGSVRQGAAPSGGTINSAAGRIDELRLYNYDIGVGEAVIDRDQSHACTPPLHHVQIEHVSGNGLTCTPSTLTLRACADAACTVPYTDGVTGTLSGSGGVAPLWPDGSGFTIAPGSSTTTERVQLPSVGSSLLAATVAAASNAHTCNFGAPSCTFTSADAGFILTLANHRAETAATLTLEAVRKADNAAACAPGFASVLRNVVLGCRYLAPASGTLPVRLAGQALNAAGSAAQACGSTTLSVNFDANGRSSFSAQYADAGRVAVDASYTGSVADGNAGLSMTGSVGTVVAPQDFAFANLPAGARTAGAAFALQLQARNAAGAVTPNFGQEGESAQLSHQRRSPTAASAVDGVLSVQAPTLNLGVLNYADLRWSEVGRIDLSARLASGSYLGSGLDVQGSTGNAGAIGPFRPNHLQVRATKACGAFSYAGQPFTVTVTARNAVDATTRNYFYDAASTSYARDLVFSDGGSPALGLGSLTPTSLAATQFSAGVASTSLSYPFTAKASGPGTLALRAVDSDGVSSASYAGAEDSMPLRSGRLVLQSAIGSAARALQLPLRLEQWQSQSWVLVTDDACTAPGAAAWAAAVAQSGRVNATGAATAAWSNTVQSVTLASGVGQLTLGAPSPSGSGALDLALNLGSGAADRACLPSPRPATTGLGLPWLRSRQGSVNGCGSREDSDPSARATFGAPPGASPNKVHERVVE